MTVRLTPRALTGSLCAIPSKSDAHRKLICASLADAPTILSLPRTSEDIAATVSCLTALGAEISVENGVVTVRPIREPGEHPTLDCGESGSTFRFLLPVTAAICSGARFTGHGRLPERPIGHLTAQMQRHGVSFSSGTLPFEISGRLAGGQYILPGDISSQYITGLLLALPLLDGDSKLSLTTRLESAAYVGITLETLRLFGVTVTSGEGVYAVPGKQKYRSPGSLSVDGDWSNAAFFFAAGALGAPVSVAGLNLCSPQGDKEIIELLGRFGAAVSTSDSAVTVGPGDLRGCRIDVGGIPDLLPVLAVVAAFAQGETVFTGGARLRLKESDRLKTTAALIRALGGTAYEYPDGLTVSGGGLSGGTADSFGDHRIAMAAAVAGVKCTAPVVITGAEAVNKSYPDFFCDYSALGGIVHVI